MAAVLAFYAGLSGKYEITSIDTHCSIFPCCSIPTAVSDYEFDRLAGLNNTPVYFGPKKTIRFLYLSAIVYTELK